MNYKIARDSYGVCMKCWKLTNTIVIDRLGRFDNLDHLAHPEYVRPIEVTACCMSEDMIPIQYASKCDTCGEWLDIRFSYPKEMEAYRCEKCETKKA